MLNGIGGRLSTDCQKDLKSSAKKEVASKTDALSVRCERPCVVKRTCCTAEYTCRRNTSSFCGCREIAFKVWEDLRAITETLTLHRPRAHVDENALNRLQIHAQETTSFLL